MTYNEKARISTYKYRTNPLNQDRIKAINNKASKKNISMTLSIEKRI